MVDCNVDSKIHFIKSKIGLLILSDNPIADYMNELLANTDDERYRISVEIICALILRKLSNRNMNIDDVLNNFREHEINHLGQEFYEYVNEERLKTILKQEDFRVIDFSKYYTRDKGY